MNFVFENNMCKDCGTPPVYDTEKYQLKLWENQYGEQILCVREKSTRKFWFHHGDCGWENKYTIPNALQEIQMHKEEWDFVMNSYFTI